jgi:hypothetical protein
VRPVESVGKGLYATVTKFSYLDARHSGQCENERAHQTRTLSKLLVQNVQLSDWTAFLAPFVIALHGSALVKMQTVLVWVVWAVWAALAASEAWRTEQVCQVHQANCVTK